MIKKIHNYYIPIFRKSIKSTEKRLLYEMHPKIVSNFLGIFHITVSLSLVASSKETDNNKIALIKPYLQG